MSFDPVLISSVGDVASFWRLLRYIPPPSACGIPFTYSFFRHDIRPEWEHARNKKGGTITIVIFDRDRIELSDPQKLDDIFQLTLVSCVGESVSDSATTLNGVMFKCRQNKPVTLQLWTAHSDVAKLKSFGNSFRDMLARVMEAKNLQKLEYFSHQQKQADANSLASRMRSFTKPKPDCTI
ncbi:translation initiation factor 4E [Angomonas deanei]|uniref:Eukaryotic initiation factor 4E, putative n=1 Tax=Angomonas deanei TaxID=59799 RepID=S9VKR0_9TRYP|nr:translation initiation factor 4E [Angomonas deanei]EPY41453.1 translation initiation factor 4E [Angomonas deanei]EPY43394.1 translation initiation factor 4E [Angomonas deanei]CAD2218759.1 Eukaryotic initiation factor 4E, putative [Angomonas deanei]|eukprot:EPY25449.1 translation initiation factor 4E [Angomonas deanei]